MILMKDIKKLKLLTRSALIFSALLMSGLSFSCSNFVERIEDEIEQENKTTAKSSNIAHLSIKMSTKSAGNGRTVFPNGGSKVQPDNLENFVLKGVYETGEEFLLGQLSDRLDDADPDDIDEFTNNIEILPGKWSFTLTAEYEATTTNYEPNSSYIIPYSCTVTDKVINRGAGNTVSFELKPQGEYGGFDIKLIFPSNSNVDKVKATLTTLSGDLKDAKEWSSSDLTDTIHYVYSGNDENPSIIATDPDDNNLIRIGTYLVIFEFFTGKDSTPINNWESYINISPGWLTEATINLSFNDVYNISLKDENGNEFDFTSTNNGLGNYDYFSTKFTNRSSFNLPSYNPSSESMKSKVFLGWQVGATENIITSITPNTAANLSLSTNNPLSLTAYFVDPILYVSETGDDETNTGFSSSSPVKTLDKEGGALDKILQYGNPNLNWTIKISGETHGFPRGYSGTNQNYGQIELPAELTSDFAKSILITGATGHSDWLETTVPEDLDSIFRGGNGSANTLSSGDSNGAALVVSTAVPVTITNLKITGGSGYNGGGILINEGATVSLGDGVLITKNRASNKGGGICNLGTLFIYGSAVIGNKDATEYPTISSTQNISSTATSNYSSIGGGIYNGDPSASTVAKTTLIANLYLGYKPSETDLSPVEEEFTGGIYCNGGGSKGGGIYNAINSKVYMNSGTLSRNGVDQGGGAIYNDDGSILHISGGNIHTNRVHQNGSIVKGGGVENYGRQSKFVMSGGSIYNNEAWADSGTDGKGGGVFNGGYMFMYGDATIGIIPDELPSPVPATSTSCSNKANMGGGIYNAGDSGDINGKLYIGYKPDETYTSPEAIEFTGGIYYNYSKAVYDTSSKRGGGGICSTANSAYGEIIISSGTIAYNSTNDCGGGIYGKIVTLDGKYQGISIHDNTAENLGNAIFMEANDRYYLKLGGSIDIPKGQNNNHDIHIDGSTSTYYSHIEISSSLDGNFETIITPGKYLENYQLIKLSSFYSSSLGDSAAGQLEAESNCFSATPQTKDDSGNVLSVPVNWEFDSTGKLVKSTNVSSGFTTFTAGSISEDGITGNPEGQKNGNVINIPALDVCDHLITQAEYEKYMTYYGKVNNGDYPPDSDNKNTTPTYLVSWVEAIVYCNLRSLDEGLTPVYTMDGEYDIRKATENPWTQYYNIVKDISTGKYFYDYNEEKTAWDLGMNLETDFSASGYRLPTSAEYAYIIQEYQNTHEGQTFIDTEGINEWGHSYFTDGSRCFFNPSTQKVESGKPTYYREEDLGFRVVRNAQ